MTIKLRTIVGLAAVPLIVVGCAPGGGGKQTDNKLAADGPCAGMEVQVAQANPGYPRLPVYVANFGGFFAKTGLAVKVAEANSGADATAALVGGSADVNAGTYGDVLLAQSKGAEIIAFAADGYEEISNLVMKKSVMEDKGVTRDSSPEDKVKALKGLRIGVTSPGSSTDLLVRTIMAQNGLDPEKDAKITPVGASAMAAAFSRGQLDAFALSSPSADAAAKAGKGEVLINFSTGEYPGVADTLFMTMNTSPATAKKKAKELACFRDGLTEALKLMKSDPDKAKEFAWEEFDGVVERAAFDATIDDNISAFSDSVEITEAEAKERQDIIGLVLPDVKKLDISETFTNLE